jgi:hypothetical protein
MMYLPTPKEPLVPGLFGLLVTGQFGSGFAQFTSTLVRPGWTILLIVSVCGHEHPEQ